MVIRRLTILFFFVVLSCAYFNTFYNAQLYFKKAEEEYRKKGEVTSTARQNYNKVIRKCSKILEFYPQSKYVDDAVYLTAISYKRLGERIKAEKKFKELFQYFPDSKYIPEAHLEYAGLLLEQGRYDEALGEIKAAETAGLKKKARILKVRLFITTGKYREALNLIQDLLTGKLKSEEKKELYILGAEAAIKSKNFDEAKSYLDNLLKSELKASERFKTRLLLIEILENENKLEEALNSTETQEYDVQSEEYRILVFKKAEIYVKKGEMDKAKKILRGLFQTKVQDTTITRAKLLLARILEEEDSIKKALEIYEGLKKSRFYFARKEASIKEKALKELLTLKEDTARVDRFRLAEIYLFELDRPDEAYKLYGEIEKESQETENKAKALYAMLLIAKYYFNDEVKADSLLKELTARFPDSFYTRQAIRRFGIVEN